jgi:diguanylate cyclase (GGDEF)-like protein
VLTIFMRLFSSQFENTISAPLGRLSSAASSVASGKYEAGPGVQAPQVPFLELSALWDAFSHMAGSVRARERLLHHLANHDPLTDLPNRTLLQRKLAETIEAARAENRTFSVLFIDLDDFKTINDAFGHQTGDLVLKHITQLLKNAAGEHGLAGRLGGDEFAILLQGPHAGEAAGPLSRSLLRELTQPMHIEGNEIYLSASIGISIYPLDGQAPDTLIQNADTAMYQAKDEGKNSYLYYSLEMETRAQERLRLRSSLHHALEQEEFHLVYQPIYRACTREMASTEALARWNSQRFGAVPPSSFIPLANETGLILPLGDWVLRTACTQNQRLAEMGLPRQRVSVNVTERQLRQKNFIDTVQRALDDTGLDPQLLTLELTENIFFQGFKEIDRLLLNVKRLGVHLSLDDFGIGYATLSCLTQIPFDEIKIDRSLANNITTSAGDAAIVRGIIRIAHDLGMQVVAEGIENEQQLRFFENQGCDLLQGYYFSKPISGEDLETRVFQRTV